MARARRSSRSSGPAKESWSLPIWLGVLVVIGWIGEQPMWLRVVVIIPATIAFGVWWVLFYGETYCNVPTPYSVKFERCTNRVRGRLSACGVTGHRPWKRQELLAVLLRRPPPQPPAARTSRRRQPPAPPVQASPEPDSWLLREASYRAWTLGIGAVGCLATVISTVAAVYTVTSL